MHMCNGRGLRDAADLVRAGKSWLDLAKGWPYFSRPCRCRKGNKDGKA